MIESIPKKLGLPLTLLFGLLTIIATFAYLEIGVRYLAPAAFPLLRTDPDVGTIHVKNFDGMAWSARSYKYAHITTNDLGYIGSKWNRDKSTTTIRIAVFGDSVVEGLEVDTINTFPALLEKTLNDRHVCASTHFEVMNFGVSGSGTFLQYQSYKSHALALKPDFVVLVFHDDYADNMGKRQFDLEKFAAERKNVGLKAFLLKFELPKFLFSKVQTNHLVRKTLGSVGLLEGGEVSEEIASTTTQMSDPYYQFTFGIIEKFKALVTQSGSVFVLLPYPGSPNATSTSSWHEDPHFAYLETFARERGITFWDASSFFVQNHSRYETFTNGADNHLIESGHAVFAEYLYAQLLPSIRASHACST